ncbi:MAG: B12-binding domain-containing radical SAM protein [Planctomycetota bacterium]|jgi:radical SAM superfamily enzyme YgiQ (UPF0313 family)
MQDEPRCLFVYPEFRSRSFWNYRATCEVAGAKYPATPLGLMTVAAMLPGSWPVRLVDCNVEPLQEEDIEWADIVFTGGMISQQLATRELIDTFKLRGKTVVVGGPDATQSSHLYEQADHLVLGEAEITLPRWLEDRAAGTPAHIYNCGEQRADVTTSPMPRFDLIEFKHYLHVGVQFARGCPFSCEFCDIIELFGRVPRLKSPPQMLAELQRVYDLGYRGHIDFVDDNFVGNKRDVKKFLVVLREWLEEHKWPFEFSTEASINLTGDDELLQLMQDVGFSAIFVGIESPDEETLAATRKMQNTKRSLSASVQKIYSYGIFVNTGYIVGFDAERGSVAQGILDLIQASATPVNMVGLLFALPNTQLQRRLSKEGRLDERFEVDTGDAGDQCTAGLNFVTARPRVDVLRDYRRIIDESYAPQAYFGRVLEVGTRLNCRGKKLRLPLRQTVKDLGTFFRLLYRMGVRASYRSAFWSTLLKLIWHNPRGLRYSVALLALYLHFGDFRHYLVARLGDEIRAAEQEQAAEPVPAERA